MAHSALSFRALVQAWRQAETVVVIVEKRWIAALEQSSGTPGEKPQLRIDLFEARGIARKLFKQILDIATTESQVEWQPMAFASKQDRADQNRCND